MTIFTGIPEEYHETYAQYFDLKHLKYKFRQKEDGFKIMYARAHPTTFAYFMLGKKMRIYQSYALDMMIQHRRLALNWARRTGKTSTIAVLSFWLTYFNVEPKNKMEKFTEVGIVSKEAEAAKKLLSMVRELIFEGDKHMYALYKNAGHGERMPAYFTRRLIEPNNTEQLTWDNRSVIRSMPPTKRIRGFGFSRLFIDEIAFLAPTDVDADTFYSSAALPTIADTNGYCCISSTPNGQSNIFYNLFQPEDAQLTDFIRLWFTWKINKDDPNYSVYVESEEKRLTSDGRYNLFRQEFLGDFTVLENQFFSREDLDKYFSKDLMEYYEWKRTPCSIGIDSGVSKCATVITVKTKHRGKIQTLYQRAFPLGWDVSLLMQQGSEDSIPDLMKRYDVAWIVPENCPQLSMIISWGQRIGYPIVPYDFLGIGEKNRSYYTYRAMIRQGLMQSPVIEPLRQEMLGIQEEPLKKYVSIGKSGGGFDDRVNSDLFATTPFFDTDDYSFTVPNYVPLEKFKIDTTTKELRNDSEWDNLKSNHIGGVRG